jgi:8-oxo-dGTP diphosphatase
MGGLSNHDSSRENRVPQTQAASEAGTEQRCEERNCLIASALLVDSRGWLLLQERDERAPVAPNQWGLVGGHVEAGEGWEEALRRELQEETGLRLDSEPELWFDEVVQHTPKVSTHLADHWRIWVAKVDLTNDDITVGEGRQIVFVDPTTVTDDSLDMSPGAAYVLERFLESDTYRAMRQLSVGRCLGGSPGRAS